MEQLEEEYPAVRFVYMTGHLDGTGLEGDLWQNNERIRAWCVAHARILYDFADIESVDPDGVLHADDTDACLWCADWWLFARLAGWDGTGLGLGDPTEIVPPPTGHRSHLDSNRPNPFNPRTEIRFTLRREGPARLEILDLLGRRVATLVDEPLGSGEHVCAWDGRDCEGRPVRSGVYLYRLTTERYRETRKLALIR